jgi:hypothetical protein
MIIACSVLRIFRCQDDQLNLRTNKSAEDVPDGLRISSGHLENLHAAPPTIEPPRTLVLEDSKVGQNSHVFRPIQDEVKTEAKDQLNEVTSALDGQADEPEIVSELFRLSEGRPPDLELVEVSMLSREGHCVCMEISAPSIFLL